jgi:HSP20 family molecular chaperone IbpA
LTNEKDINAKFENGVLSLVFPKEEEKKELVHNISIN